MNNKNIPTILVMPTSMSNDEIQKKISEKIGNAGKTAFTYLNINPDMTAEVTEKSNIFGLLLSRFNNILNSGSDMSISISDRLDTIPEIRDLTDESIEHFRKTYIPGTYMSASVYVDQLRDMINNEYDYYANYIISVLCANICAEVGSLTKNNIAIVSDTNQSFRSTEPGINFNDSDYVCAPWEGIKDADYVTSPNIYKREFVINRLSSTMYDFIIGELRHRPRQYNMLNHITSYMYNFICISIFTRNGAFEKYGKSDKSDKAVLSVLDAVFTGIETIIGDINNLIFNFFKKHTVMSIEDLDMVMNNIVCKYLTAAEGLFIDLNVFYLRNADKYYPDNIVSFVQMRDHNYPVITMCRDIDNAMVYGYKNPLDDPEYVKDLKRLFNTFEDSLRISRRRYNDYYDDRY